MTGPGEPRGGHEPAIDKSFVGRARPHVPTEGGQPNGHGAVEITIGSAPVPAVGRARVEPSPHLTADDEGVRYVEGRPGQQLAEDLAEQRRRELPTTKEAEQAQDAKRRVMPMWQEMPLLLVVSFCVAVLVRSFLVQAFMIPSSSMEDLLREGDRVVVSKIVYDTREPRRGEVVVFRGTDRWAPENVDAAPGGLFDRIGDTVGDLVGVSRPGEKDFIKRIIGLPGDTVACCDERGRVTVNGVGVDEPYVSSNNPLEAMPVAGLCGARRFAEVRVPPGELFVMGDNRAVSQDSRCQGTVPIENVVGRAFFLVWPPGRWGGIDAPDSFAQIPPPS
jgi:signal peptidase I